MNGNANSVRVSQEVVYGPYCMLTASLGYRLENQPNADVNLIYGDTWWYAPAIGQLLGIWIAGSGIISTMSGVEGFWSSTLDNTGAEAYLLTLKGEVKKATLETDLYHARAVRNLPNP